jgi:hypothetical protein
LNIVLCAWVYHGAYIFEALGGATMNIPKMIEVSYKVRVSKDDESEDVVRLLDLTDLTDDDILSYALDSIIILSQAKDRRDAMRKDGDGIIPVSATFKVGRPGQKNAGASAEAKLKKVFGEEKTAKLIEKYETAEKALEAVKALVDD